MGDDRSERSFIPRRTSYSYAHSGDLPGDMGAFYLRAGLPKAEFERARAAQIPPEDADRAQGRLAQTNWPPFNLPDPRPSFAPPRRHLDESWFHPLETAKDGRALTREEFQNLRGQPARSRPRQRYR